MTVFDWIILGVLVLALAAIGNLLRKKIPALRNVNVSTIPREQEAQKKRQLLEERLRRKLIENRTRARQVLIAPVWKRGRDLFWSFYNRIAKLEKKYRQLAQQVPAAEVGAETKRNVLGLLAESGELLLAGELVDAEKKLIQVISLDHQNVDAYTMLGELYLRQSDFGHAREVFEFALKLSPENPNLYLDLGEVFRNLGEKHEAVRYFRKAHELEPNNPKFLDALLAMAIEAQDRFLAERTLKRLREANPENQKLEEYAQEVDGLKKEE
jgi:tetratricopeptide (TPR) repeat protein